MGGLKRGWPVELSGDCQVLCFFCCHCYGRSSSCTFGYCCLKFSAFWWFYELIQTFVDKSFYERIVMRDRAVRARSGVGGYYRFLFVCWSTSRAFDSRPRAATRLVCQEFCFVILTMVKWIPYPVFCRSSVSAVQDLVRSRVLPPFPVANYECMTFEGGANEEAYVVSDDDCLGSRRRYVFMVVTNKWMCWWKSEGGGNEFF